MVDKRSILMLLGCYCRNPKLITEPKTKTTENDYPEDFHKTMFGAIHNLAKKGCTKITSFEIEAEMSPFNGALEIFKKNEGQAYIERAIEQTDNKLNNAQMYRDTVRKYSIIRTATDILKIDVSFVYNESDENLMKIFNSISSEEVLKQIFNKISLFKDQWKDEFGGEKQYIIGEGARNLLDKFKAQEDTYGFSFQNGFLNTMLRGQRTSKLGIVSGKSGSGKTRSMLGEACNIGCERIYNWKYKKWVSVGEPESALFISTELVQEEMESACLAHISGIDQENIETWNLTEEQERILEESVLILERGKVHCVEMPQFSGTKVHDTVETYVINEGIKYLYFDYINECTELSAEAYAKTGMHQRTDQILYNFALELKNICNKFDIHLRTGTQLSSNYKDEKDANALKGSKAIIEKADFGAISLPVTEADLKKLKPILDKGFFGSVNMGTYLYKNRGGRWKDVIIWSRFDLGTCREEGVFVTDYSYNLITNIQPTQIDIDFDGMVGNSDLFEEVEGSVEETLNEFKSAK